MRRLRRARYRTRRRLDDAPSTSREWSEAWGGAESTSRSPLGIDTHPEILNAPISDRSSSRPAIAARGALRRPESQRGTSGLTGCGPAWRPGHSRPGHSHRRRGDRRNQDLWLNSNPKVHRRPAHQPVAAASLDGRRSTTRAVGSLPVRLEDRPARSGGRAATARGRLAAHRWRHSQTNRLVAKVVKVGPTPSAARWTLASCCVGVAIDSGESRVRPQRERDDERDRERDGCRPPTHSPREAPGAVAG